MLVVLLNTSIFVSLKPFVPSTRRRSNLEVLVMYLAVFDLLASVMLVSQVYQVCNAQLFYENKSILLAFSYELCVSFTAATDVVPYSTRSGWRRLLKSNTESSLLFKSV